MLASTIRECVDKWTTEAVVAVIGVDHVEGVTRIYKDTFASAENDARAEELCVVPDVRGRAGRSNRARATFDGLRDVRRAGRTSNDALERRTEPERERHDRVRARERSLRVCENAHGVRRG